MRKALAMCAAIVLALGMAGCGNAQEQHTSQSFVMDTVFDQTVYADTVLVVASNTQLVNNIEALMSKTIPTSDIYKINHSLGHDVSVNGETARVIRASLQVAEQTEGAFNPAMGDIMQLWGFGTESENVPSPERIAKVLELSDYTKVEVKDGNLVNSNGVMLDLGGVVKGYALDSLKDNLDLMGAGPALVSLGGSIYARGTKPDGAPWTIGVRDPFGSSTDYMGTLELTDMCISTSGSYERGFTEGGVYYHHIIDPATGYPAKNGLVSVSVMDEGGLETDLYSTALFVMGAEKGVEFAQEHEISALFITEDKKLYKTGSFVDDFQLTDEGYYTNH